MPPEESLPFPAPTLAPGLLAPAGQSAPEPAASELHTPATAADGLAASEVRTPRAPWALGYFAFGIALVLVVVEAVAIRLASTGDPRTATIIGQVLVVLTALPLALAVLAIVRRRQRPWGWAAIVVSLVANPLILLNVLLFVGAL